MVHADIQKVKQVWQESSMDVQGAPKTYMKTKCIMYKRWKQGEVTWEEYKKIKTQVVPEHAWLGSGEPRLGWSWLVKNVKVKKCCCRCMSRRKTRKNVDRVTGLAARD